MALEKVLHSIRIGGDCVIKDEMFEEFLNMLQYDYCGVTQVAMFLYPSYHTPTRLEEFEPYLEIYKKRLQQLREKGFSAGLDILATVGHHEENLAFCHSSDAYRMTSMDGQECKGSFCMNDPRHINGYVIPLYRMFAKLHPDFIWIDDDVRYFHWPLSGPSCFCDGCIELFNRTHGTGYTRETLKIALNEDFEVRKKWMQQQSDAMKNLFRVIGSTVRSISEETVLGFMGCELFMHVYDIEPLAAALSDNGRYEIMWRPGSGCYDDNNTDSFVVKAEKIGRISANLPAYVTSIQSEMESYPCDLLSKTPTSTAAETLLYMSTGCTGSALSVLPDGLGGDIRLAEQHLARIHETVPFARLLKEKLKGTKTQGVHTGWSKYVFAAPQEKYWEKAPAVPDLNYARNIFRLGIPECFSIEQARVVMLTDEMAQAYSKDELLKFLKGGLMVSGGALEYINSLGLGQYTGFEIEAYHDQDPIEMYTEDPFNEGLVGKIRNCRPVFGAADSFSLRPTQPNVRILSRLVNYNNEELAACASGIFENSLGGRIYAVGYHPYSEMSYYWKSIQMKRLFTYLSKDTLPSYTVSHYRLFHIAHKGDGKNIITLFNMTNEHFRDIQIAALTKKQEVEVYSEKPLTSVKVQTHQQGAYRHFTLEQIKPYEMVLIEV